MKPFYVEPGRALTASGCFGYWWSALQTLPPTRDSPAYSRLRRVWEDQTRFAGKRDSADDRRHEFVLPTHETHLTATLWENFTLFHPSKWLPKLAEAARMRQPNSVVACNWSYEWENAGKICDVVLAYRDDADRRHVIVVEAKNLHSVPGVKDLRESYYLGMDALAPFDSRALLFCVDESARPGIELATKAFAERPGLITWQQLGGIQISLARTMDAPQDLRHFVAGAIQFQYAVHNIHPTVPAADYLAAEPTMADVQAADESSRQQTTARSRSLWEL